MKIDSLYNAIYFMVTRSKDAYELVNLCEPKYRNEVSNFVSFLLNVRLLDLFDINTIKNYNISYKALKEFVDIINWYIKYKMDE